MKQLRVLFIFLCLLPLSLKAQPNIVWQHPLGGSDVDCAYSILQTPDGGYITLGHSGSSDDDVAVNYGDMDYWLTKLDNQGNLQWERSYGGSDEDNAYSVSQTSDGGYILGGNSSSTDGDATDNHGGKDCFIIKTDERGNVQWKKCYGGSKDEQLYGPVVQSSDGGYLFAATSQSSNGDVSSNKGYQDIWIVKLDKFGSIVWERSFGGSGDELAYCMKPTTDGGYVLVGGTTSVDGDVSGQHGSVDYWVLKLTANGALEWQHTYGGKGREIAYSVAEVIDGGYIIAGLSSSSDGDVPSNRGANDIWVLRLAANGEIVWSKTFGGDQYEHAFCIRTCSDGGYILCGETNSNTGETPTSHTGSTDALVMKLSIAGDIQWSKIIGGPGADQAYDIVEDVKGGFVFTGSATTGGGDVQKHHALSDFWVVKLGDVINDRPLGLGFTTPLMGLSCLESMDSIRIFFSIGGKYTINKLSITGKDKNNFIAGDWPSGIISIGDSTTLAIPIRFSWSTPNNFYIATVEINISNIEKNEEYTLSVPISGFSIDTLRLTVTTDLLDTTAIAGQAVRLPISWTYEKSNSSFFKGPDIREITIDFAYNTDLLIIEGNDIPSAFHSNLVGWSCDGVRSSIDERTRTLHLVLTGTSPLPNSVDLIGYLMFKAALCANDTTTNFKIINCDALSSNNQHLIGPCGVVTTTSNATFTELPQCGDYYIRKMLRYEEIQPFSITVLPNPIRNRTATFTCKSNINGTISGQLFDMMGYQIKVITDSKIIKKGENDIQVSLGELASGVYNYSFESQGTRVNGKLVVANFK
jgi:hypothetical protein